MANNQEHSKKTPEITPSPKEPHTVLDIAPSKNYLPIALGALLVALIALATSFYSFSLNQHLQNQLQEKNSQVQNKEQQFSAELEKLQQNQGKTQEQLLTKVEQIAETRDALQTQIDALTKQLQSALAQRFFQNQNWMLLKARYYLELAQINAHWSDSFSATVMLLQQADQLLGQLNDPQVFAIRQAIAKDIASLQATPELDLAGLLSQLDAAQHSVDALNLSASLSGQKPADNQNAKAKPNGQPVWRLHLQDSMNLLSKLVIVRHNEEAVKPLLSPELEALVKESIRLNLQEAQWALLTKKPEVYELALKQAISNINKNFNEGSQAASVLIKKLSELQQIKISPEKPEIGAALPLLNQLIEREKPEDAAPNPQGGKQS